jgi:hypothetical protein
MRTSLTILATTALLAAAGAQGAAAAQPTRETVQAHPQFEVGECSGDTILAAFDVTRVVTTWYDDAGNPIRRMVHADIPGTLTNLTTGTTLQTIGVRILQFDLVAGVSTSTGTNVHVVLPGQGTLELGAGRVVVDDQGDIVVEHGRLDEDLTPELCTALTS